MLPTEILNDFSKGQTLYLNLNLEDILKPRNMHQYPFIFGMNERFFRE